MNEVSHEQRWQPNLVSELDPPIRSLIFRGARSPITDQFSKDLLIIVLILIPIQIHT